MARPKQHHYVTKAYLEGFLSPGEERLLCYGRKADEPFCKLPSELGMQRNFYAIKNVDGGWDDSLEELIGRTIENPGIPVIKKLSSGKTRLSWEERRALTLLIAFQEARTPHGRENIREQLFALSARVLGEVRASNPMQQSICLVGKDGTENDVDLREIEESDEDLKDDHNISIHRFVADQAFRAQEIYQGMKFTVFYPMGSARFLTTDNPVIRVFYRNENRGTGIMRSDIEIRFPLSCKAFLSMTHDMPRLQQIMKAKESKREKIHKRLPEVKILHLSDNEVVALNRAHVRHARTWVFTSQKSDMIPEILKTESVAPTFQDLSTKDLFHFRSQVKYDPASDFF